MTTREPKAERLAAETARLIGEKASDRARWSTLDAYRPDNWDKRAALCASFIAPGAVVADIGCGQMNLEKHLPPGCAYRPVDIVARDERTLVLDLNAQPPPELGADVICLIGLIEYIHDTPRLLRALLQQAPQLVMTYHPFDLAPERDRLSVGWVNALCEAELIALLHAYGGRIKTRQLASPAQIVLDVRREG